MNNFSYYKKIIEEKVNSCNKLLLNLKSSITTKKLSKISFLEDVLLELYDFKLETNEDFLISGLSRLDSLLYKVEIGNWDKIPLNNSKETLEKEGCVVYEGNTLKMINDIPVIKNKFKKRK